MPGPFIFISGSYASHPYYYTFTPTFYINYQIYPLYKIKHISPFDVHPTFTPSVLEKTGWKKVNFHSQQTTISFLCQNHHQLLIVLIIVSFFSVLSLNGSTELLIEVLGFVGLSRFYGVVDYRNPSWNRVMSCFQNPFSNH
jgi:hypothetical protein